MNEHNIKSVASALALCIGLVSCSNGGGGGSSQPVKLLSSACPSGSGLLPNSSCLLLQVAPSGLEARKVELRIIEPDSGVPYLGSVVLCTGGNGSAFYSSLPGGTQLITDLTAMGLRVFERRWVDGWLTPGYELKALSERFAVLLDWIQVNEHQGGKFFAVGNSGGSGELCYSLSTWGREASYDGIVLGSGPVFSRLDYLCRAPTTEWSNLCPGFVPTLECGVPPCMAPGGGGALCPELAGMTDAELWDNSILHPGADTDYGSLPLHFIIGSQDCSEWVPQALLFESEVTSPHTLEVVTGTPHIIPETAEGRAAIVQALQDFAALTPPAPESTEIEVERGIGTVREVERRVGGGAPR